MAEQVLKMKIQFRRDTTANWELYKDVIPAAGEPCFDLDLGTLKIGDGVKTYEQLDVIGGDGSIALSADGNSIVLTDGVFKLAGFDAADVGAQPQKGENGTLEWVVPSGETLEGLQTIVSGLQTDVADLQTDVSSIQEILTPSAEGGEPLLTRIEALEGNVETLNGDENTDGSVLKIVKDEINSFATKVSDDGVVNSYKELIDYVANHGGEAATMAADITLLQSLVGDESVVSQIDSAISKSETKANALFKHVKYEISNKPAEALVDYREKEIRVLCPADTQFMQQAVGPTGDSSRYYIGFKAYAPTGAVSFKEDTKATIEDTTMHYFENNDFAGVDVYGRKYSIVWLPVAKHNDDDTWTYFGINSSAAKYIGWYYSVEWYSADGKVIDSDTIRINLSNEACHNVVEPYFMGQVVKGVSVGGTLLDLVDGKINVPMGAGLKASDEITIAEDGTLGLGNVSVSKLVQEEDVELVLDGGAAN